MIEMSATDIGVMRRRAKWLDRMQDRPLEQRTLGAEVIILTSMMNRVWRVLEQSAMHEPDDARIPQGQTGYIVPQSQMDRFIQGVVDGMSEDVRRHNEERERNGG